MRILKQNDTQPLSRTSRLTLNSTADTSAIRRETFAGREHLVVPVVALVEGVITASNATGPELALASEFGKFPDAWNGRPVVLNHPLKDGTPISANSPEVLETQAFGTLFNTKVEDNKLKTEAWIDLDRVKALDNKEITAAVERLERGELTEVSVGVFTTVKEQTGQRNGQKYTGVWEGVAPDHLAILPEGVKGACSVENGCGAPRLNQGKCSCADASKCSYSPAAAGAEPQGLFASLSSKLRDLFSFRNQAENLSDSDTRKALVAALEAVGEEYPFIIAVFESSVVYESGVTSTLKQRMFSLAEGGKIVLGSEVVEVRPETKFIPIQTEVEETNMPKAANKVDQILANKASGYTEDDREFLLGLKEEQLDKIHALVVAKPETKEEAKPENKPEPKEEQKQLQKAVTPEEAIKQLPNEYQEVLTEGLSMLAERKDSLVAKLRANSRCEYTEEELRGMKVKELERLAKLAGTAVDYSGRVAPRTNQAQEGDDSPYAPEPLVAFPVKQAS